jgi:hypothetical protein
MFVVVQDTHWCLGGHWRRAIGGGCTTCVAFFDGDFISTLGDSDSNDSINLTFIAER